MMTLYIQRLYAITKVGKTTFFDIYIDREAPAVKLVKGQLDGKTQEDIYQFKVGKNIGKANETTPLQQAEMYARSRVNDLLDEGYKHTMPQRNDRWNTDKEGRRLVMLAAKDKSKIKFPAYVQRKYDGMRCPIKREGGAILLRSRNGKVLQNLRHLAAQIPKQLKENQEMDGELYAHGYTLQQIISMVKTESPDNLKIQYRCYDILKEETTQDKRLRRAKYLCSKSGKDISFAPTYLVNSLEELEDLFALFIEEGYEGAIIRQPKGQYWFGFRDNDMIKYKEWQDDEFTIIGGKEAEGRDEGTVVFLCQTKEGVTFDCRPKGTREQRREWLQDIEKIKGQKLTVRYQKFTADGKPFHPVGLIIRNYE